MKRIIFTLLLYSALALQAAGQVPQKFSYQASLRNADGSVVANEDVSIKVSLRKTAVEGEVIYTETHNTTSNSQGVVTLAVGGGTPTLGTFAQIDWSQSLFIQVDVMLSEQTEYTTLGVSQILSVPYAFVSGNGITGEGTQGQTISHDGSGWTPSSQINVSTNTVEVSSLEGRNPEEPIFTVRNTSGDIVFAIYESGVRFNIATEGSTKASKGGFAVGGLSPTKEEIDYFTVNPDSVRFSIVESADSKASKGGFAVGGLSPTKNIPTNEYLSILPTDVKFTLRDNAVKGSKGGFAVGGLSPTKAEVNFFTLQSDSIRFNIVESTTGKASKGGFAVGGLSPAKGEVNYFTLNPDSVRFNIIETVDSKSSKGGFAVGGLSPTKKAPTNNYLSLLPTDIRLTVRADEITGKAGGFAVGGLSSTKEFTDYITIDEDSTFIYTSLTATGDLNVAGNLYTGGDVTSPPITYNGYTYQTVQIGNQLWMKENLRSTQYQDGSPINTMNDVFDYETNPAYRDTFGLLYSYSAVRSAFGFCPEGWHIPNQGDFEMLFNWLGGDYWFEKLDLVAARLYEVGFWDEATGDVVPNNLSNFSARPGGRGVQPSVAAPEFYDKGQKAYFWTSGDGFGDPVAGAYEFSRVSGESIVSIPEISLMTNELYYVRCLKWNYKDDKGKSN